MLSLRDICKSYDHRPVLRGVSLDLVAGDCCLLLGSNGTGKTTLLNLLSGRLKPDSGTITFAGPSASVGVVGHQPMLHAGLTVRENATFFARMLGVTDASRVESLAVGLGLAAQLDQEVRFLSRGQLQRAGILRALVADPVLLLLDEPFTGLDEAGRSKLISLMETWRGEGRVLLFTSHETETALAAASRGCVLKAGLLALDLQLNLESSRQQLLDCFRQP